MTTLTTTYSFMDLLKKHDYVPNAHPADDAGSSALMNVFDQGVESLRAFNNEYDFMDLLKDTGQIPARQEVTFLDDLEHGFNSIMSFVSESAEDYNFLDLVQDRAFALRPVPVASNDNHPDFRRAS